MINRKGIILAGGLGSRLYPITNTLSKQLLPIYDKPMIYYPLCTLMSCGIREILIITTKRDVDSFKTLLGNGSRWGLDIQYLVQPSPDGLAQAFILGEAFIDNNPCALILGDNIFYGEDIDTFLQDAISSEEGASIFGYQVSDPERYGVVNLDKENNPINIEEKPLNPSSNIAITGLYFYDSNVCEYAKTIKPSDRGEYEITDLNNIYLDKKELSVEIMSNAFTWLDTGTHESFLEASSFIATLQKRRGQIFASPELVSLNKEWITKQEFEKLIKPLMKSNYGKSLSYVLNKNAI